MEVPPSTIVMCHEKFMDVHEIFVIVINVETMNYWVWQLLGDGAMCLRLIDQGCIENIKGKERHVVRRDLSCSFPYIVYCGISGLV